MGKLVLVDHMSTYRKARHNMMECSTAKRTEKANQHKEELNIPYLFYDLKSFISQGLEEMGGAKTGIFGFS